MITNIAEVREGRLTWPENKPRSSHRVRGAFATQLDKALRELGYEIERWRPLEYVVSRNNQRVYAGDPAVALWWVDRKTKELRVLACDKYDSMASNAHAIFLTLDAMRALGRWGAYTVEQAAQGAKLALPPPEGQSQETPWRVVLGDLPSGVAGDDALAIVQSRYRKKAAEAGGDEGAILRLNLAIEKARAELKP